MSIRIEDQEKNLKAFALTELEKALELYTAQKYRLKKEFSLDLNRDKEIIKKLESRLSLLNTKITTIAMVLTEKDHLFTA